MLPDPSFGPRISVCHGARRAQAQIQPGSCFLIWPATVCPKTAAKPRGARLQPLSLVKRRTLRWREPDSNHRSRVRKSGRCQVPAIRPGSVEHGLWEEGLRLPWRAETSNSRSRRKTSVLRPMISARTAWIDDNLGRGTDGSNPLPSSGESTTNRCTHEARIATVAAGGNSPRR